MSVSITLTTEDNNKISAAIYLLEHLSSVVGEGNFINISVGDFPITYNYNQIVSLASWFETMLNVINYSGYTADQSLDPDYINSFS